jgi:Ca-activated chloride channel family protein
VTFLHPWILLLVLLPLVWAAWEWPRSTRRAALALKALAFAAIFAALSRPMLTVFDTKVAVVLLADTSSSITSDNLATESAIANRLQHARGRNWLRVVPFATSTRSLLPGEHSSKGWQLRHTDGAGAHATDLEAAIRDGAANLPAGIVPRLVLISDGNENRGSAARAIWQAQQLGVPVDTIAVAGHPKPGLLLESVSVPGQVFSGERFPIEVTLEAPRATQASVDMTAEGRSIGSSTVALAEGVNHLRLQATVNTVGAIAIAGKIAAAGLGETHFENAVTLRRPRVLVVSQDPTSSEQHLARVLDANQFEVEYAPTGVPQKLDDYQLIVINNWNMQSIPLARKTALEAFVNQGGGLLWIAGERNVYVEKRGREEDPLERTLPAKLAPPRSTEGTAVVLIIDKSSSMEGRKIELARLAAIGVVDNLRPIDSVGVLIFDNSFQWAVPIRKATDPGAIGRLIAGITPDGGTQIAPALTEAYQRILPVNAVYKHIVLLTDGISEEGDAMELAKEALSNRVTISTVGLGQDVNRAFLEKVATTADGKSYFLSDPSGLQQILLRDVQEHTGATAVEKAILPKVVTQAEVLDGVDIEHAPALRGYVRFEARPTSDIILEVDHDPLFVRWQYGLGRGAVFTSDAKNRWAANWVTWPGFDRLWANISRDLLPHAPASESTVDLDRASNQLVVDYHLSRNAPEPSVIPDIFVFGPDGFEAPLAVGKIAAGHYRGRLSIGPRQGLFRVRPLADSLAFPEVGFYRQEDEVSEYGNNEPLLRQIAAATGGHFDPSPRDVFDPGSRSVETTMELWPVLLAMALILNLVELVLRKWRGLAEALHLRPTEVEHQFS